MNFKKTVAIATAVGALAAVSVPAMAMENQFNGMYRLRAMLSNFQNSGAPAANGGLAKDPAEMSVFEQRARLQYTAKASDDLKLVTQFEIDSSWGDAAYANGRGTGGAMGADTVNLETKHVYLDFNCPLTGSNFKVGIQAQSDAYKGVLFNDDLGGVFLTKKLGAVNAKAGFSRLLDANGASPLGKKTTDLYVLEAKSALSKDLTLGGSYYLVADDTVSTSKRNMHMLGVNAAAKFGMVSGDAFFAYQTGDTLRGTKTDLGAYAAQVAAKVNLDKAGTLRANALYLSGDDGQGDSSAWQSLLSYAGGLAGTAVQSNNYYDSKLMLLARNIGNMDSDKALITNLSNLTLLTVGYDAKISDKVGASVNLGYGMVNEKGTLSSPIGTEINVQIDYKMFANLTTSFQAAYVILGDRVKNVGTVAAPITAENPYLAAVLMNYAF